MDAFQEEEIALLEAIWRGLPEDHVWCGWASVGEPATEIAIYRTRAHWRRFRLTKSGGRYLLHDERDRLVAESDDLPGLLARVEAIPGLRTAYLPEDPTKLPKPGKDPQT